MIRKLNHGGNDRTKTPSLFLVANKMKEYGSSIFPARTFPANGIRRFHRLMTDERITAFFEEDGQGRRRKVDLDTAQVLYASLRQQGVGVELRPKLVK